MSKICFFLMFYVFWYWQCWLEIAAEKSPQQHTTLSSDVPKLTVISAPPVRGHGRNGYKVPEMYDHAKPHCKSKVLRGNAWEEIATGMCSIGISAILNVF